MVGNDEEGCEKEENDSPSHRIGKKEHKNKEEQ
jgi:hypothetical protein